MKSEEGEVLVLVLFSSCTHEIACMNAAVLSCVVLCTAFVGVLEISDVLTTRQLLRKHMVRYEFFNVV